MVVSDMQYDDEQLQVLGQAFCEMCKEHPRVPEIDVAAFINSIYEDNEEPPAWASQIYGSRSTNGRRTAKEMGLIRHHIRAVLLPEHPMTVRQVFYQLVGRGVIAKTEAEYKGTVVRLLTEMRRSGRIPFGWIADNTRWMRKPRTHGSLEEALHYTAQTYRRSLWNDGPEYVEIWLEKDALAGVLVEETGAWDVPLLVTRGYPSLSYIHEAAESIQAKGKPAYLYYFGDHDPSGVDIPRHVEERLNELAPGAEINFEVVAVTPELIEEMALPTRPTKKTDTRSKNFEGESVEVDAIPPAALRELVRNCIERHVNQEQLKTLLVAEESERGMLTALANNGLW